MFSSVVGMSRSRSSRSSASEDVIEAFAEPMAFQSPVSPSLQPLDKIALHGSVEATLRRDKIFLDATPLPRDLGGKLPDGQVLL